MPTSTSFSYLLLSLPALRFAEYVLQNYNRDPDVKWILDYNEIHLIIHANPDGRKFLENGGYADDATKLWRKNRNDDQDCTAGILFGTDLNRNFPFKWNSCPASERCSKSTCQSPLYRGPSKASEAETRAITNYASALFQISNRKGNLQTSEAQYNTAFPTTNQGVFIDMHSFGRDVGWPWGFKNQKAPNDQQLGALGRKMASYGAWSLWAPTMPKRTYGFDGGTIDYMHGYLGVASYFYELGTKFYQDCADYSDVIDETFPALLYAAKVARSPYITPYGPDILCTTISLTTTANNNRYITVNVEVSDEKRVNNVDDGGSVFSTGRQNIQSVEIYLNCHPYDLDCSAKVRKATPNAGRSATVSMRFLAPSESNNNVLYIRAKDSFGYFGPVTARKI